VTQRRQASTIAGDHGVVTVPAHRARPAAAPVSGAFPDPGEASGLLRPASATPHSRADGLSRRFSGARLLAPPRLGVTARLFKGAARNRHIAVAVPARDVFCTWAAPVSTRLFRRLAIMLSWPRTGLRRELSSGEAAHHFAFRECGLGRYSTQGISRIGAGREPGDRAPPLALRC